MADDFRMGDHYLISDRTGLKIRASESRKEWTGQIVHKDEWESRQPQDLVRARPERIVAQNPRPRPPDTFIGPLTTLIAADAEAGSTALVLESAVRMQALDRLNIVLDSGDVFLVAIDSVIDEIHIIIASPLPSRTSVGKQVTDNTAMALPEIG